MSNGFLVRDMGSKQLQIFLHCHVLWKGLLILLIYYPASGSGLYLTLQRKMQTSLTPISQLCNTTSWKQILFLTPAADQFSMPWSMRPASPCELSIASDMQMLYLRMARKECADTDDAQTKAQVTRNSATLMRSIKAFFDMPLPSSKSYRKQLGMWLGATQHHLHFCADELCLVNSSGDCSHYPFAHFRLPLTSSPTPSSIRAAA